MNVKNRIFLGLTILALLSGGAFFFFSELKKIKSVTSNAWTEDHRGDCGVVLTGGPGRVREGMDLLAQGRIRKLIVSGVYPKAQLRDIFPQWPYYGPVSEDDVVLEKRSLTTFGNAQQSLALVEALKCVDVILITSQVHMYRAQKIFENTFPEGIRIYPRAIVAGEAKPEILETMVETIKSMFYRLWAY